MSKRGENIYKRADGRYEGRYKCGINSNGKTMYRSVYAKTYTDCKNKLIKAKGKIEQNKQMIKLTMTVKELCSIWLSDISIKVKVSTLNTYERIADKHILNKIGSKRICDVTLEMLNNIIKEKLIVKNAKGNLSPRTVVNIIYVMKAIFKYAERIYGTNNPAAFVTIPKVNKSEIDVLNKDEIQKLVDYCVNHKTKYTFAVRLCLMTGLRIGELCAIRYSDIDLNAEILRVNKTVQRVKILTVIFP
ncbi:MAG: tyrosine-type recombinase/integrase family protein [Firmicutes bacterium]|nr:tyrosine-type recombinase/integrase family protein [Bacillota bacterium]